MVSNSSAVNFSEIENLQYGGGGQFGNAVTVVGTPGNDNIVSTPGQATDADTIAVGSLLPLQYNNLGAGRR